MRYLPSIDYLPGMLVILIIPTRKKESKPHLLLVDKKVNTALKYQEALGKQAWKNPHPIIFYKIILELPRTKEAP